MSAKLKIAVETKIEIKFGRFDYRLTKSNSGCVEKYVRHPINHGTISKIYTTPLVCNSFYSPRRIPTGSYYILKIRFGLREL